VFEPKETECVVHLPRSYEALINKADWDLVMDGPLWQIMNDSYAARKVTHGGLQFTQYMHRLITKTIDPDLYVDHRDGNGFNNTRNNLRVAPPAFNAANRPVSPWSGTGYKGVTKVGFRYRARIKKDGTDIHLGMFTTPLEAAAAYDAAAVGMFGEFAWTNLERDLSPKDEPVINLDVIPF
jgi:hypothetical protein